jgi:hypothetical protein
MNLRAVSARALLIISISALAALPAFAQRGEGPLNPGQPQGITVDEIIQRFAAKEKLFQDARDSYTYRQSVQVMTVDGDTVTGEYQEVFDVLFDANGNRIEQVKFAPQSTLENGGISMTEQDLNDIRHLMPFVLTTAEIPEYDILYKGTQQEDELHCYVFDIAPKKIEKNKRYFQGRIWVDDHDLQIVKTYGKSVPDIRKKNQENLFPKFTTWRQQIDGVYWFPVYTRADDVLHFSMGDVHIREIVKYEDYKRFGSKVKITYQGQELPGQSQPNSQSGQQPPSNAPQGQPNGQPGQQPPSNPPPAQPQPPTKPQ